MSSTTSPSLSSSSLNSPSLANSGDTDATSRSSTPSDNQSTEPDSNDTSVNKHFNGLPWILHRILECQLSCELPLRIMFSFNSGQKLPNLRQAYDWWQHGEQGKLLIKFLTSQDKVTPSLDDTAIENLKVPPCGPTEAINTDHHPRDRFMDHGNERLLDQDFVSTERDRRQSEGLPPSFVQKFCLDDVFTADYEDADFSQALAGLDYIRDLEVTRRASLREAAQRLGITKETWMEVLVADPDAYQWVENMQALEVEISTYYAAIFIDLRIWTMIHELQSAHFYKPNVHAMFNTLFPPVVKELPNDKIEKSTLHKHRANLYDMILKVEKRGPLVLKLFIEKHLRPGTKHSWPEIRSNLELYFERADNMITAASAIHDIRFFRDQATKYVPPTPSLNDRPNTSESGNTTISSQHSRTRQGSTEFSIPTAPGSSARTFNSSKTRQRIYSRRKISTPAEQKSFFEPLESSWAPQRTLQTSDESGQSFQGRKASRSATQQADTSSLLSRRARAESTTLLRDQGSEAVQHESFIRMITPFAEKRQEVVTRKETISGRPSSFEHTRTSSNTPEMRSMEVSLPFSPTPEMGSYYNPRPSPGSRKASSSLARPPLINDNFEFLKRPYEPEAPTLRYTASQRTLKTVSSIGNFFLRKKSSTASMRDNANVDNQNALDIEIAPLSLRPAKSTETFPIFSQDEQPRPRTLTKQKSHGAIERSTAGTTLRSFRSRGGSSIPYADPITWTESFPRFSQDTQSRPRLLRKQASYSTLQSAATLTTVHSVRSRAPSTLADLGLLDIAGDDGIKHLLKPKLSLPNLKSKRFYEKADDGTPGTDHFFVQTGDEYERYRHVPIPREAPAQALKKEKPKKEVRKAKSFASIRTWATTGTADTEKTVRPRKSSVFRREPEEGEKLRARMISEPFPIHLQHSPAMLSTESLSKEYTRKWFIEEGHARRFDLNPPAGDPVREDLHVEKPENEVKLPGRLKKVLGWEEENEKEFEMPRATPKPPVRPDRQRLDSIFPLRLPEPPKQEKENPKLEKRANFAPIVLGKYTKYLDKQMI